MSYFQKNILKEFNQENIIYFFITNFFLTNLKIFFFIYNNYKTIHHYIC